MERVARWPLRCPERSPARYRKQDDHTAAVLTATTKRCGNGGNRDDGGSRDGQ
ncbi:hypothetical protein GCM10027079_07140 [Sediminivirga luteola]|uniref:Uncharacterized protein n=1 Tax=Sediminivirga luteola TaxID=1774748 RepID=A0A8J2XMI9_9MICO|nr:hypothetical protein GCM10011333_32100 [Sediminivirga luteola]